MIVKEFDYVQGNTVIKPQRKSKERDRKKYEELKRSKKNRNRRLLEKKKNRRSAMLQIALTILIAGTVIISRDANVSQTKKNTSFHEVTVFSSSSSLTITGFVPVKSIL